MGLFGSGMKIEKGKKYDLTQVSENGITEEELQEIEKKNKRLINIFKALGATDKGMAKIDLARAMDGFLTIADENHDGKLTEEELEKYAETLKNTHSELEDITAVDLKEFLKAIVDVQKGDTTESTKEVILNDELKKSINNIQENLNQTISEMVLSSPIEFTYDRDIPEIIIAKTPQESVADAFKDGHSAIATIDATKNMIGNKKYKGKVTKGKGSHITPEEYPKTINMPLPQNYGGGTMKLTLIDPLYGIYESSSHDRQFKIGTDENGNLTLVAHNTEQLNQQLEYNLLERSYGDLIKYPAAKWTENDYTKATDLAREFYNSIGVEKPTKSQMDAFIADFKANNPNVDINNIKGKQITVRIKELAKAKESNNFESFSYGQSQVVQHMKEDIGNAKAVFQQQKDSETLFHAIAKALIKQGGVGSPTSSAAFYTGQNGIDIEGLTEKEIKNYEDMMSKLNNCIDSKMFYQEFENTFGVAYDAKKLKNYHDYNKKYILAAAYDAATTELEEITTLHQRGNDSNFAHKKEIHAEVASRLKKLGLTEDFNKFCLEYGLGVDPNHPHGVFGGTTDYQIANSALKEYTKWKKAQLKDAQKQISGGKTLEQMSAINKKNLESAYGTKQNLIAKVQDYATAVNIGAAITKGFVIIGATVVTAGASSSLIGGALLVGAETTTINLADKSFDGNFKFNGLTKQEVKDSFEEGGYAAGFVLAGGGLTQLIAKGCNLAVLTNTVSKAGGSVKVLGKGLLSGEETASAVEAAVGSSSKAAAVGKVTEKVLETSGYKLTERGLSTLANTGVGIGAEYLQTGEVTVGGTIMTVVMTLSGEIIAYKAMGAKNGAKNTNKSNETVPTKPEQTPAMPAQTEITPTASIPVESATVDANFRLEGPMKKPSTVKEMKEYVNSNPEYFESWHEKIVNGNGKITYTNNELTYQIHYENGQPITMRVLDASGNRKFYKYENGAPIEIELKEFISLKHISENAYQAEVDALTAGKPQKLIETDDYIGGKESKLAFDLEASGFEEGATLDFPDVNSPLPQYKTVMYEKGSDYVSVTVDRKGNIVSIDKQISSPIIKDLTYKPPVNTPVKQETELDKLAQRPNDIEQLAVKEFDDLSATLAERCKSASSEAELDNLQATISKIKNKSQQKSLSKIIENRRAEVIQEAKVRQGNNKVEIENHSGIDLTDPKYYKERDAVLKDIQQRLEREMGVMSEADIDGIATRLSSELGIDKAEVLETMSRLTQFGNMKSLNGLAEELKKLGVTGFYGDGGISSNSAFSYIQRSKGQMELIKPSRKGEFSEDDLKMLKKVMSGGDPDFIMDEQSIEYLRNLKQNDPETYAKMTGIPQEPKAFILDDASLTYLEKMKPADLEAFKNEVAKGEIVLVQLDGAGVKVGNDYFSHTMLDGSTNLEELTRTALTQKAKGASIDEVLNGSFNQRIDNIFGKDFRSGTVSGHQGITTIKIAEPAPTSASIAKQVRPNMPDAEDLSRIIDSVVDQKLPMWKTLPTTRARAKAVLTKYYDFMGAGYSTESFATLLQQKHEQILKRVSELGKTADDIVYVYPYSGKSYDVVLLQYSKANGIDLSKFKNLTDMNSHELNGKVVVLLDDVVGSGQSMVDQSIKTLLHHNCDIIASPIQCAPAGHDLICKYIPPENLIYDQKLTKNINAFENSLTPQERKLYDQFIGNKGFSCSGGDPQALSTGFQYMVPDNCSTLGGYFTIPFLNDISANKAIGTYAIPKKLQQYFSNKYGTVF